MNEEIYVEIEKTMQWHYQNLFTEPLAESNEIPADDFGRILKMLYEKRCRFLMLIACHKAFINAETQNAAIKVLLEWLRMAQEKKKTEENRDLIEENEELQRICLIYWEMDGNYIHTDLIVKVLFKKIMRLWEKDSLDYFVKKLIDEIDKLETRKQSAGGH